MAEFTSEIKREGRPVTLYITLAVAVVALGAVLLIVRYQKNQPAPKEAGPIVIPGMMHAGNPEFEAYKDKVRIENVKASIGIPVAGPRYAIIDGEIMNEGSRSLEAVEMRITLYDVYDNLSKQIIRTPLRPGIGVESSPMEPLQRRTFHFGVESVEQLWNPKRVEIEISGLKYKE